MNNEDLRVKRTKKLLSESLMKLMKQKSFEKISVVDICENAMVHRATFYSHFEDKYALLKYCMKDFESPFNKEDVTAHDFNGCKKYYLGVAEDIMNQLVKNKELCLSLIKKNREDSLMANIRYYIMNLVYDKFKRTEENGFKLPIPINVVSTFYGGAAMAMIEWWLETGMPFSVDELIKYLDYMIQLKDF